MWSQWFVERYAREKHQAHLSEAAHDRLPRDLRVAVDNAQNRPPRVRTAPVLAGAAMIVEAIEGRLFALVAHVGDR